MIWFHAIQCKYDMDDKSYDSYNKDIWLESVFSFNTFNQLLRKSCRRKFSKAFLIMELSFCNLEFLSVHTRHSSFNLVSYTLVLFFSSRCLQINFMPEQRSSIAGNSYKTSADICSLVIFCAEIVESYTLVRSRR